MAGAIYVGRRQVGISDRQSRILEQQLKLDGLKYRSELFQRRFDVYEATARFLSSILSHADRPEGDIERRYLLAMDASKFLFAPEVSQNLKALWKESCAFFVTKAEMNANYRRSGSYGDGLPDKEFEQLTALNHKFENLGQLFGDELQIADPAQEANTAR